MKKRIKKLIIRPLRSRPFCRVIIIKFVYFLFCVMIFRVDLLVLGALHGVAVEDSEMD